MSSQMLLLFAILFGSAMAAGTSTASGTKVCTQLRVDAKLMRIADNSTLLATTSNLAINQNSQRLNEITLKTEKMSIDDPTHPDVDYQITFGDSVNHKCNTSAKCDLSTGNSTADIYIRVQSSTEFEELPLFLGIADSGAFSKYIGNFEEKPCETTYNDKPQLANHSYIVTRCCTAYASVPKPDVGGPKCTKFHSRTIFYTSAMQTTGTMTSDTEVAESALHVQGSYAASDPNSPDAYTFKINRVVSMGMGSKGNFSMKSQFDADVDSKYLYEVSRSGPGGLFHVGVAGRIIVRNGVMEMEEGRRYSPTDDCIYFTSYASDGSFATSEFCCKNFQA